MRRGSGRNCHDRQKTDVELVTPCFCAGAAQEAAEIRVPSIRGQVRWWFRALGGGASEEKRVFGGVHPLPGDRDARRSALRMRLEEPVRSNEAVNVEDLFGRRNMTHPQSYLLWPLRPTRQNDQKRGRLPAGTRFGLRWTLDDTKLDRNLAGRAAAAVGV